jgi:flagellar L-ring protein precursor FlgH
MNTIKRKSKRAPLPTPIRAINRDMVLEFALSYRPCGHLPFVAATPQPRGNVSPRRSPGAWLTQPAARAHLIKLALFALLFAALSGCAGPATAYKFPERKYVPSAYKKDVAQSNGLLWGEDTQSATEDNRSRELGDIVVVRIEEAADASKAASTDTARETSVDAGIDNLLGLVEKWASDKKSVDKSALIKALYRSGSKGSGQTNRRDTLTAMIPCQVKQVMPNGDLFVVGTKTILINREETNLYLSGVVRPYDIDMRNMVSSTRILDARIDFSGRGVISDKQGPGLLQRGADTLWPF